MSFNAAREYIKEHRKNISALTTHKPQCIKSWCLVIFPLICCQGLCLHPRSWILSRRRDPTLSRSITHASVWANETVSVNMKAALWAWQQTSVWEIHINHYIRVTKDLYSLSLWLSCLKSNIWLLDVAFINFNPNAVQMYSSEQGYSLQNGWINNEIFVHNRSFNLCLFDLFFAYQRLHLLDLK